ncbi:YqhV family protein [Robertmurraya sp. DFI.2.37]|jgi:putative exporter of polyketide antibiotics|uniref:YqhV family protein n=1 Tax=Robertmurraya sp. DFI.2.37 TaxID=3031819 RepID=UPI0012440878|nr:YqhV family protein [Robertmurraya sp. DFI.2.37]MDF1511276.1 YqhV family protein [Robertmurraya sp. DFI.2.37]
MFQFLEKAIIGMALLRILSGSIEIFAALLILKVNQVDKALVINSSLALIGPIILILTTTIGLIGIAEKVSFTKMLWIFCGVGLILYGVKSS